MSTLANTHQGRLTVSSIDDCWNRIGVRGDHSCGQLVDYIHCRNCPVFAQAATDLLDGDLSLETRRQWSETYGRQKATLQHEDSSIVVFRIVDEWLGFDSCVCSEFTEIGNIHTLPHRHDTTILGLTNIRGQLMICASLSQILGIETQRLNEPVNSYPRFIVLQSGENSFVLPVDEVTGLLRFHTSDLGETPNTVNKANVTYTKGILNWNGKQVGYLDHELLIFALNQSLA